MEIQTKIAAVLKFKRMDLPQLAKELGVHYQTIRRCLIGDNIKAKSRLQIESAVDEYCRTTPISMGDLEKLIGSEDVVAAFTKGRGGALFSGYWLLVQYRTLRSSKDQEIPPDSFRTAVVRYGRAQKDGTTFEIQGPGTWWTGRVERFDQDKYFYVATSDKPVEKLAIIMMRTLDREETPYHFGVVLGIAAGIHDRGRHPVYASRVLLQQVPGALVKNWKIDISFRKDKSNPLCVYSSECTSPKEMENTQIADYLRSSFDRLTKSKLISENFGDRIFVAGQ